MFYWLVLIYQGSQRSSLQLDLLCFNPCQSKISYWVLLWMEVRVADHTTHSPPFLFPCRVLLHWSEQRYYLLISVVYWHTLEHKYRYSIRLMTCKLRYLTMQLIHIDSAWRDFAYCPWQCVSALCKYRIIAFHINSLHKGSIRLCWHLWVMLTHLKIWECGTWLKRAKIEVSMQTSEFVLSFPHWTKNQT